MNENNLSVKFIIEKFTEDDKIFEYEQKLPNFYVSILEKDEVNFYYFLKDSAFEIEEKLFPKIHTNKITETNEKITPTFRVVVSGKELYHYHLEDADITALDFKGTEVDIFYFLKKIAEKFESKVSEEHKRILLGK